MTVQDLIYEKAELTHSRTAPEPIVLSTRIRLARNLENSYFPDWAKMEKSQELFKMCKNAIGKLKVFENASILNCEELTEVESGALVERHLISPEFAEKREGSGVLVNSDQSIAVMINEEDHLRIQVLKNGYKFGAAWKVIDEIDNEIDACLDYAFSPNLGYLTACPTNLGTGLRASIMMHLPGLVIVGHMEKVIRACNHLNIAVRGIYGEGSEATGSIFQISNQQTLGESETEIIRKLTGVLDTVVEQERNARRQLIEVEQMRMFDKIGRAYGILSNVYSVSASEAMNLLSLMRLGVDFNILPGKYRRMIDRLLIETQPAHMQLMMGENVDPEERDSFRAMILREKFRAVDSLNFEDLKT